MSFQPNYVLGLAGQRSPVTAEFRRVLESTSPNFLPGGRKIDGTKTRDPGNYPYQDVLRAGLVMGPVTGATGVYANSFLGRSTGTSSANGTTLAGTGTSLCVGVGTAVELVRRQGTTGTFKLLGPPAAAGTVRYATVTYSAVNTSTGVVTITALGVNEVQTVNLVTAGTAGNLRLIVQKVDGTYALTPNIAWSATDATLLSNANTALDTATGVTGGIVATAIAATDTDLGIVLTYSGTGYAGLSWGLAEVHTLFTSNTGSNVVRTTTGVDGRFLSGSWVCPTDGSEVPTLILPDGPAAPVTDASAPTGVTYLDFPLVPMAAHVRTAYIVDYPTDTAMKTYLKEKLSTLSGPKFMFDDAV